MKNIYSIGIACLLLLLHLSARAEDRGWLNRVASLQPAQDTIGFHPDLNYPRSVVVKRPLFISGKYTGGTVLKTNESLRNSTKNTLPFAQYGEIKVGFSSEGNRWKDIVYGMPYYGLGIGFYDFSYNNLGRPISVYLVQGATLKAFSPTLRLKYEWNFGGSFNWKPYDPIKNPTNESIGAKTNIYFGANIFLTKAFSKYIDLEMGLSVNHVSNGATKMPNSGVNTLGAFIGLTYHFDRERVINEFNPTLKPPVYEDTRLISDFAIHPTRRQRRFKTEETGLATEYVDHNFFVLNASYALLNMPVYKYRYGLGIDFIYDESAGATARKVGEKSNGLDIAEVTYGKNSDRFQIGLSARGDIVMPKYTVWAQLGVNLYKGADDNQRFYQSFGVKAPFWKGLYGSFSIRARGLCKAEYFFLGVGYAFDHKPYRRRQ